jgi:hypothetical protein
MHGICNIPNCWHSNFEDQKFGKRLGWKSEGTKFSNWLPKSNWRILALYYYLVIKFFTYLLCQLVYFFLVHPFFYLFFISLCFIYVFSYSFICFLLIVYFLIYLINYYPKTINLANFTRANLPTAGNRSLAMAFRDNFYSSRSHRCQTSMQLAKEVSSWRKKTTGTLYCQRNLSTTAKFSRSRKFTPQSSYLWHRVIWSVGNDFREKRTASVTSPEDGGIIFFRDFFIHLPDYTGPLLRRQHKSYM